MGELPVECPRCEITTCVLVTCMGGLLTKQRYDDINHATCERCGHRGKAGDWQRIAELRSRLKGSQ